MPRISVGKSGAIRAHCVSENQKKSGISIASSLATTNHASPALGIPLMGPDPNNPARMGRGALAWIWWYELGYLTTDRQEKGAWVRFGLYGVSARAHPHRRS